MQAESNIKEQSPPQPTLGKADRSLEGFVTIIYGGPDNKNLLLIL